MGEEPEMQPGPRGDDDRALDCAIIRRRGPDSKPRGWVPLAGARARQCERAEEALAAQSCRQWHPIYANWKWATEFTAIGGRIGPGGRRLRARGDRLFYRPAF